MSAVTVEEKRDQVYRYCADVSINECLLANENWEHKYSKCHCGKDCLRIGKATEAELDRALDIINLPFKPHVPPEPCVLEQTAEDADTVIKIKSNRKIKSLTIEFEEEVKA